MQAAIGFAGPPAPAIAKWLDPPLGQYDETIARALCAVATWSYSDEDTFSKMLARPDFPDSECVTVTVENASLFVSGTARLIQSRDGRVAILSFRGTSPFDPIAWLGNFSMPTDPFYEAGNVHGGFNRTLSAMFPEIDELLVNVGLLTHGRDAGESVVEAQKAAMARIHPLPGAMPLDLVRRYQILEDWLGKSKESLSEDFKEALQKNIEQDGGSLVKAALQAFFSTAPSLNELLTDPSAACEQVRTEMIRGAVLPFLNQLGKTAPEEIKARFEREQQRALQNEVQKIVDRSLYAPNRQPLERLYCRASLSAVIRAPRRSGFGRRRFA
jgi:hypothetical protein